MLEAQHISKLSRQHQILSTLTSIFEELSGIKIEGADSSATFLELGFDSLFLTQVTQSLQHRFGLRITFRQLLDQQSTLEALAAFVDSHLPADRFADETKPAPQPSMEPAVMKPVDTAVSDSIGPSTGLEAIVRRTAPDHVGIDEPATGGNARIPHRGAGESGFDATGCSRGQIRGRQGQTGVQALRALQARPEGRGRRTDSAQEDYINALIERYTERTAESKRLTQHTANAGRSARCRRIPLAVEGDGLPHRHRASRSGSRLWDVDGNEYIDLLNGFGPIMFGHAPLSLRRPSRRNLNEASRSGRRRRWPARSPS